MCRVMAIQVVLQLRYGPFRGGRFHTEVLYGSVGRLDNHSYHGLLVLGGRNIVSLKTTPPSAGPGTVASTRFLYGHVTSDTSLTNQNLRRSDPYFRCHAVRQNTIYDGAADWTDLLSACRNYYNYCNYIIIITSAIQGINGASLKEHWAAQRNQVYKQQYQRL